MFIFYDKYLRLEYLNALSKSVTHKLYYSVLLKSEK